MVQGRAVATGYVQRSKFFASDYITFRGGQKGSNTERTIRSTDVADEGRGRVVGKFFSAIEISVCGSGASRRLGAMFKGQNFLRMSILLFKAGRCVRGAYVVIY